MEISGGRPRIGRVAGLYLTGGQLGSWGENCYDVRRVIVNRMMADIWRSRVPARRLHGDK